MHLFFWFLAACGGGGVVEAFPRFHQVNQQFFNGTTCPAVTRYGVACPVLCVKDTALDCPAALAPSTCPPSETLCPDGSCRSSCTGVTNVCRCASHLTVQRLPCRAGTKVNITHWDPTRAEEQTLKSCSNTVKGDNYTTWAYLDPPSSQGVWNICSAPPGQMFPIQAPFVIATLGLCLLYFICFSLWYLYKSQREKPLARASFHPGSLKSWDEKESNPDTIQYTLTFKGYVDNGFGYVAYLYTAVMSVIWVACLLILCLDYYGHIGRGLTFSLTYGSYDLSSKFFCVVWFLSTAWYLVLNLFRSQLRNFFRLRQPLHRCIYVQIDNSEATYLLLASKTQAASRFERLQALFGHYLGLDIHVITTKVCQTTMGHRYIEFHCRRYIFDNASDTFVVSAIELPRQPIDILALRAGLDTVLADKRYELVGPNRIEVIMPSFGEALWQELTSFFYIYQIQILWCYFYLAYWHIGLSDTCVILLAAIVKVVVRLRSTARIKTMAEHEDKCTVMRDGVRTTLTTAAMVPGDVFELQADQTVPVDAVILQGHVIADESSLTGEPMPIPKISLREEGIPYDRQTHKAASLFAGTVIRQASPGALAFALATRTETDKGQLLQKILFPHPVSFVFQEQLKVVFCILIGWALVLLGLGSWWLGGTGMTAWFYGTICAAQVMNPLLPAMLVVGQSIAARRLKKLGIYCVDLPRILVAGKIRIFCFDKTGTLTEEGLDCDSVYPVNQAVQGKPTLLPAVSDPTSLGTDPLQHLLATGMAVCHSVTMLHDDPVGNPVDMAMFHATGARLSRQDNQESIYTTRDHGDSSQELVFIYRERFEFQHARMSMSVVVTDTTTETTHLFCKGSFERLAELARPEAIPQGYHSLCESLASEGCYVLAMGYRTLDKDEPVQKNDRERLERDLDLIGLIVFRNSLRPDTEKAMAQLRQGDVRPVMITGDTLLTGVHVAKECGMLSSETQVVLGDVNHRGELVWTTDNEKGVVTEYALTGKAFRVLVDTNRMDDYLLLTRVFARMTPSDKMECVELFKQKTTTAMCGDGGNDCGALRAAHVGLALSEAEASAVSPFSTPRRSIMTSVDLIRQGRAALATSFASYKYLIMYGESMALVKLCTFYYTMSFSQWNFILVDAFITVFCSFAVTQSKAATHLSSTRPTARILGPEVLLSVIGQLVINAAFLGGAYGWLYTRDDFFRCNEWDARAADASQWWLLGDSFEADILTFISLYQFVNAALLFNYGYKFRQAWYRNYLLLTIAGIFIAMVSFWELADPNAFGCLVRVNCGNPDVLVSLGYTPPTGITIEPYNNPLGHNVLPRTFRYKLYAYSVGNLLATHLWEVGVILGPIRTWARRRWPRSRLHLSV